MAGPSEGGAEPATIGLPTPADLSWRTRPPAARRQASRTTVVGLASRTSGPLLSGFRRMGPGSTTRTSRLAAAVQAVTLTRTAGELSPLMPSFDGVEKTARYSVEPPGRLRKHVRAGDGPERHRSDAAPRRRAGRAPLELHGPLRHGCCRAGGRSRCRPRPRGRRSSSRSRRRRPRREPRSSGPCRCPGRWSTSRSSRRRRTRAAGSRCRSVRTRAGRSRRWASCARTSGHGVLVVALVGVVDVVVEDRHVAELVEGDGLGVVAAIGRAAVGLAPLERAPVEDVALLAEPHRESVGADLEKQARPLTPQVAPWP